MKIMYVHGFASSSQSRTSELLRKYFPEDKIFSYDIPVDPKSAVKFLRNKLVEDDIDLVIGTSLGAYYTLHTFGCAKIAINPPFNPNDVLDQYLGKSIDYLNPRESGSTKFFWSIQCHDQIEELNKDIESPDLDILWESTLMFGTSDDVVTDKDRFEDYWTKMDIPCGHRVPEDVFRNYVVPEIEDVRKALRRK